jgi:transposase
MKSRLIKAQNQRVERITPSTLVVGIDIAKENHAVKLQIFEVLCLPTAPS